MGMIYSNIYRKISAANDNAALIKAGIGNLRGWYIFNTNEAVRYVKFYDKATAPSVGTDTPVLTLPIPAGGGANVWVDGVTFALGLGIGMTTAYADNSTAAVGAGDLIVNVFYV